MLEFRTVELHGRVEKVGPLEFLWAVMPVTLSPFAVIHYAYDGKREELGLRLDLDKKVFLDQPEAVDSEVLRKAAEEVASILAAETAPEVRERFRRMN